MKAWPLHLLLLVAVTGCAGNNAARPAATTLPAWRQISWAEAKALIRQCRAREVGQTHSRLVTLSLRHGGRRFTREPKIDDVVDVLNAASKSCGAITFATE